MFKNQKEKIVFIILLFVSVVGVSSGINYQHSLGNDTLSVAKKTFEFGMYYFFAGEKFIKIFLSVVFSFIRHFLIFSVGGILWITYPFIPINLFCVGFKMGVAVSFVVSILKINGFASIIFLCIYAFFIIFASTYYCFILSVKKMNSFKQKGITTMDLKFFTRAFLFNALLSFGLGIFLLLFKNLNLGLFGIFKTFL